MRAVSCPRCGLSDRIVSVGLVLDAGSVQPTGSAFGGLYGMLVYEVDLPASRRLAIELERLRTSWVRKGGLRGRRDRRRRWKVEEARLRAMAFCVRDEAVIADGAQTSSIPRMMRLLLDEAGQDPAD